MQIKDAVRTGLALLFACAVASSCTLSDKDGAVPANYGAEDEWTGPGGSAVPMMGGYVG